MSRRSLRSSSSPQKRKKTTQKKETPVELEESDPSIDFALPCREAEFQEVRDFVLSNIQFGRSGSMYISGLPGTGKSAVVQRVITSLQETTSVPDFHFVEVNGMKLADAHRVFGELLWGLKGTKDARAVEQLGKFFASGSSRKKATVILVDELDLLWTRKQEILYQLFEWPNIADSKLTVLTIANTLDLPERMMTHRVASRLGMVRLSFQPYTFQQLAEIIRFRLPPHYQFDAEAIEFVSRKVAAISGDIRRAVDVCNRAAECRQNAQGNKLRGATVSFTVSLADVQGAIKEMFSGVKQTTLSSLSLHERLVLRSLVAEGCRTGLEDLNIRLANHQYQNLCHLEGVAPLQVDRLWVIYQSLASCQLICCDWSHPFGSRKVRLNVGQDDVNLAFRL